MERIPEAELSIAHTPAASFIPAPLRRAGFRRLWVGMTLSYTGDRLQQLAQGWLVAIITGSALAVGWIAFFGSLPLLLGPLGGVIADQVNRRPLLVAGQLVGAAVTAVVALLVVLQQIAIWHIYVWALVNGVITLLSRPAYKVMITNAVPPEEVRPAVAINSMTETGAMVGSNAGGSLLLGWLGLPIAFVLNTVSYLAAAGALGQLEDRDQAADAGGNSLAIRYILSDLRAGFEYLLRQPQLLHPLLLTFVTITITVPAVGLLPAIVHGQGGSIISLGMLTAAFSMGALAGAAFAGARYEGERSTRTYAFFGLVAAAALAVFASLPVTLLAAIPLGVLGFVSFAQAVWNTSRIGLVAAAPYQARLQAITSLAFNLGFSVGMLWGGVAIDRFGLSALSAGAVVLGVLCVIVAVSAHRSLPT
ncbi:MAG: MFS transporter [Chloroflexota bacterium]|nr:MFS transporter [Chloroflexota bacterium]